MAAALTDRVWRSSSPQRIEADLTALWQELAREAPVSRAVMSNLVVVCRRPTSVAADPAAPPELPGDLPIDEIAGRHPARLIVVHYSPELPSTGGPSADARVGVVTFGPRETRYGVEQIVVRSACVEAALPSIVRPFLLGDIPTSVWWVEDFSGMPPLPAVLALGRQLLFDSRSWQDVRAAVAALAPVLSDTLGPDLADVNWRRLLPLRRALVHALESTTGDSGGAPSAIRISHRSGESALAWLLAGWLQSAPAPVPWAIEVSEDPQRDDDVLTLSIADRLRLRLDDHRVVVEDARRGAAFTVAVPQETAAEAIAAELRMLTRDRGFHDALRALALRFGPA
jgi:hypothetical protein